MALSIRNYVEKCEARFVQELVNWLRIPSISTLPEHAGDVRQAAQWIVKKLGDIGFPVTEVIEGDGHPLVYGEWLGQHGQPTLLIYGHYDVQPVDPLGEWQSPPFEPVVRNNAIYARGATDDKGQVMIVMAALEAWVREMGGLPINVKILLEGEEEAGGASVDHFVREHSTRLQADAALICDTHMTSPTRPSMINGLRGIVYGEIRVRGAKGDLHSGSYGGVAPNPIHALCLLFASLKGIDGTIKVPGIYDNPLDISDTERQSWQENSNDLKARLQKEMGVSQFVGENSYLPQERLGIRPTLEIHGIRGGFTGTGAKTVIPAEALAKFSLRIPAETSPKKVFDLFAQAVGEKMPVGYTYEVELLHHGEGITVSPDNPYIRAAAESIAEIFGEQPIFIREGGSIPIASLFDTVLNMPVVLMGFGLPGDGAHGPNEKFSLSQFTRGILTVADFLGRLKH